MSTLSKNAQSIKNVLDEKGLATDVVELSSSTRTAVEAANTINCEVAQIVKSLIFRTKESKQALLVLTSGINRVNEKTIKNIIGEKIEKADADFTKEVTGYTIGGIPPIGHKENIKTLIDEDLLNYDTLWAAAGTPFSVFSLPSSKLQELTEGEVVSVK